MERKSLRLTRSAEEEAQLRDRAEEVLSKIEEIAADLDHPITTHVTEGTPSRRIVEFATEHAARLIVVGRQGMTGLGKRLLGGVTEQILHGSDVPVLVIPDSDQPADERAEYDRILIPTDGSEGAETATPYGVAIAERYEATIHVLNVVDLQAAGGVFSAGGLEEEFVDRLEANGERAVDAVVSEIEQGTTGLAVETEVVRTTAPEGAANGIREYVAANEIDLVVMGSHGQSNLKRQLLGSVASALLRSVDAPVLIVTRETK